MSAIKDIIIDLLVLGAIIALNFFQHDALVITIWIYTGLLLAGKTLSLFMPRLQRQASKTETPDWVYHLIYFLSVAVLVFLEYYYLAGAWVLIWVLSIIASQKRTVKQP